MHPLNMCAAMCLAVSLLVGCSDTSPPSEEPVRVEECGPTLRESDGREWVCTFADNFDGRRLDRTKWTPRIYHATGISTARACFTDDPRNIAVEGGELLLTVRKVNTPVVCAGAPAYYTSGSVSTYRKFSQQYGRFEARVKVAKTQAPGLKEAFWLWPDDRIFSRTRWPAAGEIDIMETYSKYHGLAVPFLHYTVNDNGGPRPGVNTAWHCQAKRGVYNTYTLTWTPTKLAIAVNGVTCLVNTSSDPAFHKPYIASLTSALGVGSNALTANTPLPATMSVDYVRVWR
ncbi:MAG: glycoside hydrolase family 16 protein [Aeromicrobium sp.]